MALTEREAFKTGFLARCAVEGLSADQMLTAIKQAQEKVALLGEALSTVKDLGKGIASTTLGYGIPALALAPPMLGGAIGYGLARATDIDDTEVADIKDREVIDEYRRQTEHLKRQRALRDYQKMLKRPGRMFL